MDNLQRRPVSHEFRCPNLSEGRLLASLGIVLIEPSNPRTPVSGTAGWTRMSPGKPAGGAGGVGGTLRVPAPRSHGVTPPPGLFPSGPRLAAANTSPLGVADEEEAAPARPPEGW